MVEIQNRTKAEENINILLYSSAMLNIKMTYVT
jgi:hypothetical protein